MRAVRSGRSERPAGARLPVTPGAFAPYRTFGQVTRPGRQREDLPPGGKTAGPRWVGACVCSPRSRSPAEVVMRLLEAVNGNTGQPDAGIPHASSQRRVDPPAPVVRLQRIPAAVIAWAMWDQSRRRNASPPRRVTSVIPTSATCPTRSSASSVESFSGRADPAREPQWMHARLHRSVISHTAYAMRGGRIRAVPSAGPLSSRVVTTGSAAPQRRKIRAGCGSRTGRSRRRHAPAGGTIGTTV